MWGESSPGVHAHVPRLHYAGAGGHMARRKPSSGDILMARYQSFGTVREGGV